MPEPSKEDAEHDVKDVHDQMKDCEGFAEDLAVAGEFV